MKGKKFRLLYRNIIIFHTDIFTETTTNFLLKFTMKNLRSNHTALQSSERYHLGNLMCVVMQNTGYDYLLLLDGIAKAFSHLLVIFQLT